MTRTADSTGDLAAVEAAFEAALAGRSDAGSSVGRSSGSSSTSEGIAAFTEAVRASAVQPGRPSAALADLFATGLLTDQSSPSARTAPSAGNPSRSRSRRRRRFAMLFPALLAKILSAGALAQAATGAGIAVVVVTGVGAAGGLPGPVQAPFSAVTGLGEEESVEGTEELPQQQPADEVAEQEPAEDTAEEVGESEQKAATDGDAAVQDATEPTGPAPGQPFGEWLNGRVEHGEVDGKRVSQWAHERNEQRREDRAADRQVTEPAEDDVVEDEPVEDETEAQPQVGAEDTGDGARGGNGGKGKGKP